MLLNHFRRQSLATSGFLGAATASVLRPRSHDQVDNNDDHNCAWRSRDADAYCDPRTEAFL